MPNVQTSYNAASLRRVGKGVKVEVYNIFFREFGILVRYVPNTFNVNNYIFITFIILK